MVTNFKHLGEGRVRLKFKTGPLLACTLLDNNRALEVLCVEFNEGCFAQVGYEDLRYASVPLKKWPN